MLLLLGFVWWPLYDFTCFYHRTPAERRELWQEVKQKHPQMNLPDEPRDIPSALELLRFHGEVINPLILAAAKMPKPYIEDYYALLEKLDLASNQAIMPVAVPCQFGIESGEWLSFQARSWENGSRLGMTKREAVDSFYRGYLRGAEDETTKKYELATSVEKSIFAWRLFIQSLWNIYWRGLLLSFSVFLLRIVTDRRSSIKDELLIAPGRFLRMLILWPLGLIVYPQEAETAVAVKYRWLEAEFRRDKKWDYHLTREEEDHLKQMAHLPFADFKKVLRVIAEAQKDHHRRSVVMACAGMFWLILVVPLVRIAVIEMPVVATASVCLIVQQLDDDTSARAGPLSDHLFFHNLPAILNTWFWVLEEGKSVSWEKTVIYESPDLSPPGTVPKYFFVSIWFLVFIKSPLAS